MPTLSSAMVQAKLASLRDVEEALARQVLYGGDLVTNLLEQAAQIDEATVVRLLGETTGLEPASVGELPPAPPEALRLLPGDVALRHGLYPLGQSAEGQLLVAVSEPLPEPVDQDLAFALGARLIQRIAPLVRIRQAIARDYGLPLDRRTHRLIAKLDGKPDPSPSLPAAPLADGPELSALPRPPSIPPIGLPAPLELTPLYDRRPPARAGPGPARARADTAPPDLVSAPAVTPRSMSAKPDAAVAVAPVVRIDEPTSGAPLANTGRAGAAGSAGNAAEPAPPPAGTSSAAPPRRHPAPSGTTPPPAAPAALQPPASGDGAKGSTQSRSASAQHALPGLAAWSAARRQKPRAPRRARHRGPYTAAQAEEDMMAAQGRDDILNAFFDFAAQYFEYAVLFAVHGDLAEGRDAHGGGADRASVTGIGVPLDLPSALARVRSLLRWTLQPFDGDGLDAQLLRDLKRPGGKSVLLLPVTVGNRCVLILYGDDGDSDVELSEVGEVIAFAPLVATALENLIRRRKAAAREAAAEAGMVGPPPRPKRYALPPLDDRAEALAKALAAPGGRKPEAARTPPTAPASAESEPARAEARPGLSGRAAAADRPLTARAAHATSAAPRQPRSPQERAADLTPGPVFPLTRRSPMPLRSSPAAGVPDAKEPPEEGWDVAAASDASPESPDRNRARLQAGPEISIGMAVLDEDIGEAEANASLPGSRSVAVAPQPLMRRHSSEELKLPSVIVDLETDCRQLVDQLLEGDPAAESRLIELGSAAVPSLLARFPGPLPAERDPIGTGPRRASDTGPVLRTLAKIGPEAAPFLVVRSSDANPEVRRWATLLLGEMPTPDAAHAVARRLLDEDAEVRRAAREAGSCMQLNEDARVALRDATCSIAADAAQSIDGRTAALEALVDWRDPLSIPRVIELVREDVPVSRTARWALLTLTRQDFGADVAAWKGWWQANAGRHRVEWLIAALSHDEIEIRRAAGDELKQLTKEYFGYYEDLPPAERAHAQRRYRQWWETSGKARFSS